MIALYTIRSHNKNDDVEEKKLGKFLMMVLDYNVTLVLVSFEISTLGQIFTAMSHAKQITIPAGIIEETGPCKSLLSYCSSFTLLQKSLILLITFSMTSFQPLKIFSKLFHLIKVFRIKHFLLSNSLSNIT